MDWFIISTFCTFILVNASSVILSEWVLIFPLLIESDKALKCWKYYFDKTVNQNSLVTVCALKGICCSHWRIIRVLKESRHFFLSPLGNQRWTSLCLERHFLFPMGKKVLLEGHFPFPLGNYLNVERQYPPPSAGKAIGVPELFTDHSMVICTK